MTESPETFRPDWDAIELHYRAGIRSLRDIAAEFQVSNPAIIKHARKHGIVRGPKEHKKVILRAEPQARDPSGFLYVIYFDCADGRFFKIGRTTHFSARLSNHQCAVPFELCVACAYFVDHVVAEERELHALFETKRVRGEWFSLTREDLLLIASRSALV